MFPRDDEEPLMSANAGDGAGIDDRTGGSTDDYAINSTTATEDRTDMTNTKTKMIPPSPMSSARLLCLIMVLDIMTLSVQVTNERALLLHPCTTTVFSPTAVELCCCSHCSKVNVPTYNTGMPYSSYLCHCMLTSAPALFQSTDSSVQQ